MPQQQQCSLLPHTTSCTKLLYWEMFRFRISTHGPSTRSKRALSNFTHLRWPTALTVAARGRFRSRAISPRRGEGGGDVRRRRGAPAAVPCAYQSSRTASVRQPQALHHPQSSSAALWPCPERAETATNRRHGNSTKSHTTQHSTPTVAITPKHYGHGHRQLHTCTMRCNRSL